LSLCPLRSPSPPPPGSTLFPYTTLFRSNQFTLEQAAQFASANTPRGWLRLDANTVRNEQHLYLQQPAYGTSYLIGKIQIESLIRSEEHTSELQSRSDLVCRLLLEKKKKT